MRFVLLAITTVTIMFMWVPLTKADGAYNGKTLRYLIGSKPGGGYDLYGRLVAKYIEKHLAGSTIVPENRPTAGGVPALREVRFAEADQPILMMFNTGLLLSDLGGLETLDFGIGSLNWVGKAASESRVLVVRTQTGISSFEDLKYSDKTYTFLTSSFGSAAFVQQHLLKLTSHLNIKIVSGFGGSEAEAALMKQEADGLLISESNVPPLVETGIAIPLVYFGKPATSFLDSVPDALSLAATPDQILIAETISALAALGRPTVVSPSISEDALTELREAYMAATTDPAFLKEAAEFGLPLDPLSGAETQALAATLLEGNPRLRELVAETLKQ